jgi:hypothetical protein
MDVGISGGCAHESQKSGSFIRFPNIVLDFSQNVIIYPNMLPFEMVKTVERIERRLVESLLYCLGLMGNIYEYNDLLGVQGKVE